MPKCKVQALLLCEKVARAQDGKVSLEGLFDSIIVPRSSGDVKTFFVYYRVVVLEPCTVALKVIDPEGNETPENYWRDSIARLGPRQAVWPLSSDLFTMRGPYGLELMQENEDSGPISLAEMRLTVAESDE